MKKYVLVAAAGIFSAAAWTAVSAAGTVTAYSVDAEHSRVEFVGVQAGADFKGVFHKFTAAVAFAPDALENSDFDVQIDLNSVDSMDKDRDKTIRGPDIFDVAHQPSAHYLAKSFAKSAAGYTATGTLTLHGVTKPLPIDFQFTKTATGATLEGSAKLKRLDFGVGQGDWKSTEWVGDAVKISFSLVLKPKP
jgi:polyisoprenoid-binding protein YceI